MVLGYAIVTAIWLLGCGALILYFRAHERLRANRRLWSASFLGWFVALLPLFLLVTPADRNAVEVVVRNWLLLFASVFLGTIAVSFFSRDR